MPVIKTLVATIVMTASLGIAPQATAEPTIDGGGAHPVDTKPPPSPKLIKARILRSGKATISADAPRQIREIIRAGNQIVGKPYLYGGGHSSFRAAGYDCSGTVSYALRGAKLVSSPLASGGLMSWGQRGYGRWISVYANSGHAFMQVAGIRLDTSREGDPGSSKGPRWRPVLRSPRGYQIRHPRGL